MLGFIVKISPAITGIIWFIQQHFQSYKIYFPFFREYTEKQHCGFFFKLVYIDTQWPLILGYTASWKQGLFSIFVKYGHCWYDTFNQKKETNELCLTKRHSV